MPRITIAAWLLGALCFFSTSAMAGELDGLWRLSDKPVWIQIEAGVGLIAYSEKNPEDVGKTLLRNLVADDEAGSWQGEIYVKQLEAYKATEIVLDSADSMKLKVSVGFFRKTVVWQRSDHTPVAQAVVSQQPAS